MRFIESPKKNVHAYAYFGNHLLFFVLICFLAIIHLLAARLTIMNIKPPRINSNNGWKSEFNYESASRIVDRWMEAATACHCNGRTNRNFNWKIWFKHSTENGVNRSKSATHPICIAHVHSANAWRCSSEFLFSELYSAWSWKNTHTHQKKNIFSIVYVQRPCQIENMLSFVHICSKLNTQKMSIKLVALFSPFFVNFVKQYGIEWYIIAVSVIHVESIGQKKNRMHCTFIACAKRKKKSTTQNEKYWANIKDRRENTLHLRRVLHSFSIIVFVIEKFFIWFIIEHWMVWAMIGEWPRTLASVCVCVCERLKHNSKTFSNDIEDETGICRANVLEWKTTDRNAIYTKKTGKELNRIKLNQIKASEMSELYVQQTWSSN